MGGGKGSGSTSVQMTPEQRETISLQNAALRDVFLPSYTSTVGGAKTVYDTVNPTATGAANTAMGVAGRAGTLQEQTGTGALQQGAAGSGRMANVQSFIGDTLTGTGSRGLTEGAGSLSNLGRYAADAGLSNASAANQYGTQTGQGLANVGAFGSKAVAGEQYGAGQGMQSGASSALAALFNPQYKKEQISAAMQPAREEIREQLSGQNAMFGGAGGLGSSRMALANRNMSQLGEQRLASAAAQASGNVEAQRQAAANSLLGAGQNAINQSANLYQNMTGQGLGAVSNAASQYGNIFGTGANMMGQGANAYGQVLNAGQGANAAAQTGYANLANMGQQNLAGAQQSAASSIGYAQTPQDVFSKYASVVFGVPQASTTPNYAGTQGQRTSSKGFGF